MDNSLTDEQKQVWDSLKYGIGPVTQFQFIGDGKSIGFSSRALAGKRLIHIMVDGVVQSNFRDFGIVGNTIRFNIAPSAGAKIDLTVYDYNE